MADDRTTHTLLTGEDRCPDCGAAVAGERDGCQALWIELGARAYIDIRYAPSRDLAFDAYCMQHLDTYCRSGKSYAAHLTRLCCGLEHAGAHTVYFAIQRWLNDISSITRPEPPAHRGTLTVADALPAGDVEAYRMLVQAWAGDVWEAYSSQHELAHSWIQTAMQIRKCSMPYPEFEGYET
jgi:hypothetical protein